MKLTETKATIDSWFYGMFRIAQVFTAMSLIVVSFNYSSKDALIMAGIAMVIIGQSYRERGEA